MAHTKTPWAIQSYAGQDYGIYGEGENNDLAIVRGTGNNNVDCNAAHIVRCVNSHDKLICMLEDGALQFTRLTGDSLEVYARTWATLARAALKLAKGE